MAFFNWKKVPLPALIELPAPAEVSAKEGHDGTLPAAGEVFEQIETDLKAALIDIKTANAGIGHSVRQANDALDSMRGQLKGLANKSHEAATTSAALSRSTEELSGASGEIARQIDGATTALLEAASVVREVSNRVQELSRASQAIGTVVDLISDIAGQTNLLALNATIEAARAGLAGKGFAVVAQEVKLLASRTQLATVEVRRQIETLRQEASVTVESVGRIGTVVGRVEPMFQAIAAAVQEQTATISHVAETAQTTAGFVTSVESATQHLADEITCAARITVAANLSGQAVDKLSTRLMVILRENSLADRRRGDRYPVDLDVRIETPLALVGAKTVDLSRGGVLIAHPGLGELHEGTRTTLHIATLGRLDGRVVAAHPGHWHIHFDLMTDAVQAALLSQLAALRDDYEPFIERAQRGALAISEALEAALQSRQITSEVLFSTHYDPVEGSDPPQFTTASLSLLEGILPALQEPLLEEDRRMTFCAAVDRNGYLPVHNLAYSKPQRMGDVVWNTMHSRNRRIFDDRAGFAAARNLRPFLIQSYSRDMGHGATVLMKEVDAPILVQGRHWGGLRMAYQLGV